MIKWKTPQYKLVTTLTQLDVVVQEIQNANNNKQIVCIDVETTGPVKGAALNPYCGWLLGIAIATTKTHGYYIPLAHTTDGELSPDQLTQKEVINVLNPVLSTGGVYLGHNIKFDYKFLYRAGLSLFPCVWDSMIAQQILHGDRTKSAALKSIVFNYVDIPRNVVKTFNEASEGDAAESDLLQFASYAIRDTIFTLYLYEGLKPIVDQQCKKLFYDIEMPLLPVLAQMELRGIKIDPEYYKKIKTPLIKCRNKIEKWFLQNYEVSVSSSDQLGKMLIKQFPDEKIEISDKGNPCTGVQELNRLARNTKENSLKKICKHVLMFRGINKALNTYIEKYPKVCTQHPTLTGTDYILHTNFNQLVNSGRFSSSPNIQNISRDTELISIRRGFIPRETMYFVDADWASAEYRLVGVSSKDPKIFEAYRSDPNTDFHRMSAQALFNKEDVTVEERREGKTFNFAYIYGATKYGVARALKCSLDQGQTHIDNFDEWFAGLTQWKKDIEAFILKHGYIETTYYHRRRYLPAGYSPSMHERWKYEGAIRALINHVIQGNCADLLKMSMVKMAKRFAIEGINAHILTTTHDSIVVETSIPDRVSELMRDIMEVKIEGVLMPVDIDIKTSFSKG